MRSIASFACFTSEEVIDSDWEVMRGIFRPKRYGCRRRMEKNDEQNHDSNFSPNVKIQSIANRGKFLRVKILGGENSGNT